MRISVVIPTFNREHLVGRAIESAIAQEGCELEIVVVDDASTDGTAQILTAYEGSLRVIRNASNLERGASRNLGVAATTAPLVAFLDSDDYWEPQKLSRQLRLLAEGRPCVTGARWLDEHGRDLGCRIPPSDAASRLLDRNLFGSPSALALPRALFERVGGFPEERDVQGVEDWLFLIRLHTAGYAPSVVPECLVNYVEHPGASTSDVDGVAKCMWAGTGWVERNVAVDASQMRTLRRAVATSIARQYAYRGAWARSGEWVRRSWRTAGVAGAARSIVGAGISALKGALDRIWS